MLIKVVVSDAQAPGPAPAEAPGAAPEPSFATLQSQADVAPAPSPGVSKCSWRVKPHCSWPCMCLVPQQAAVLVARVSSCRQGVNTVLSGSQSCGLTIGGQQETFASCNSLTGVGPSYNLLWTLEPTSVSGESVLHMAIEAPSDGWVGWGIPAQAGRMVGTSAVIVKSNSTSSTGGHGATGPAVLHAHSCMSRHF